MSYSLVVVHSDGTKEKIPVSPEGLVFTVIPGDEVQLLDANGRPKQAAHQPEGTDLKLICEDGVEVYLKDFYSYPDVDPITVSLEPQGSDLATYEMGTSAVGNLPGLGSFTLMRLSSTGYIDFVNQFEALSEQRVPGQTEGSSGLTAGGSSGSATPGLLDQPENSAPIAVEDLVSARDGEIVNIELLSNDSDPDSGNPSLHTINGQAVVIGIPIILASGATVTPLADGSVDYDPGDSFASVDEGESATDSFTYTIIDADGDTSEATVTVQLTGMDQPILATPDQASVAANATVTINVLANDSDPDTSDNPLTVVAITQPALGTVINNGTNVTFDPGTDFDYLAAGESAIVTFTYTADTPDGDTVVETVTITVTGRNDAPDAVDNVVIITENAPVTIAVLGNDTDPDSDPLTITGVTQPANGSVSFTGTELIFNPGTAFDYLAVGQTATETFTYTISDGNGGADTATVTVTITGQNDAPDAGDNVAVTTENAPVTIAVLGNDTDPDSDPLTITGITQPANGSVSFTRTEVIFNPGTAFDYLAIGQTATETFTYTISDGNGGTDTATVTVTINGQNDVPDAINDVAVTTENAPVTIAVLGNDTDPDSDPLIITGVTQPANGSVSFTGTEITFNPGTAFDYLAVGENATETFTYTISDGNGGTDTATVTVTINGQNDAPDASNNVAVTTENAPVTIAVLGNDTDPDSDPLTITGITQPANGSVSFTGTEVTFNPGTAFDYLAVGETAIETFTYTISDGNGGTDTATVTVTISGQNDAPVANANSVVSPDPMGNPITINVIANATDVDGTLNPAAVDLNPSLSGIQTSFTVAGQGVWTTDGTGNVTFTPDPGLAVQPTPISYTISDNDGATSNIATLTIRYSAADVWFGNDESGSVSATDFTQSRDLISGTADLMDFGSTDVGFNAALFTWASSNQQQMVLSMTDNETSFVTSSAAYTRNFNSGTDVGAGIVFGTNQILASVAARELAGHPRAGVPQVMVIMTDATPSQILNDASLLADAQAAKDAGITLVIVAIQEAQEDPVALARLTEAASLDVNGDPLIVTADSYVSISAVDMADLLQTIREGAAASMLPPIVIDMDGDGAEFDNIAEGIAMNVDEDTNFEQIAWADEDDAVLVYDANNNQDVDGPAEFAFASYSENPDATDLEGLRAGFDSNNDGILSASDDRWSQFKLWQDADGDGLVGEREMISLDEAGVESISLISDGNAYSAANGDVYVHGESDVTYTDGSVGIAADAEFSFIDLVDGVEDSQDLEIVSSGGEIVNLDEGSGLDLAPVAETPSEGFDSLPESGPSISIEQEASQMAVASGV